MVYLDKRDYEERYGEVVGRCNIHKIQVIDKSCPECEATFDDDVVGVDWTCAGCEEWVEVKNYSDDMARIEKGLLCFHCTYENKGGE